MNKPIYLALGFLGALLVASITLVVLIPKGDTTAQATYILPTRPSQTSSPSFSLLGEALPSSSPTIDLSQSRNCVYTDYFWRDYPEAWPDQVMIAGQSIPKNLAAQWIQSPSKDAVLELQRVLYVTLLNIGSGADRSVIDKTIRDASDWLAAHPSNGALSDFDQSTADLFINTLEDYNNGLVGPELCPNQPKTPTPTATALIQVQPAETTPAPSATPSPSQKAAALTSTPLVPVSGRTATLSPTQEPQQPLASPSTISTNTPTRPTSTPKPPTATPLPPSSTPPLPSLTPVTPAPTPFPTPVPPASTPTLLPTSTQTPEPSVTPTGTPTRRPTRTLTSTPEPSETPTSAPTHRPTSTSTSTPEPPTGTPTPEPTSTSTPEPTSTPTIAPTSTATPRVKPTHRP